jgi:hypothetical protein
MAIWEFTYTTSDGTVIDGTLVADAETEGDAAASVQSLIADKPEVVLARPGTMASPDVEARWREVVDFPAVVSNRGRFALYAHGSHLD